MNLSEINGRFLKFLYALEPFGPGNIRPVFSAENVRIEGMPKLIGKNFDTIKFNVNKIKLYLRLLDLLRIILKNYY